MIFHRLFTLFFILPCIGGAQSIYTQGKYQFIAYEKIPTWSCVASDWETQTVAINLYDHEKYKGHADFVSFGLKRGITFAQFKEQVKHYTSRKYLPFFIYDLRKNPMKINGNLHTWAIWLEDYSYDDNPEQITETTLRLFKAVEKYIAGETGKQTKGVLILAVNEKAKPNTSLKKSFTNSAIETIVFKDLFAHYATATTQVLNEGNAVGTLRYVKASENETVRLNPRDIVIFEKAPLRVPPVAGIFTLEPQTPLSHVNLLAKNRGTLNVCTNSLGSIPNLQKNIGKHVKISCTKKEILITEIPQDEFEKFSHSHSEKTLEIPKVLPGFSSLINLDKTDESVSVNVVGAKAANFSTISKAFTANVGKGYAVPFTYYLNHLATCKGQSIIDSLVTFGESLGVEKAEKMLNRVRKRILETPLDTLLINEIKFIQKTVYKGDKIRLRSSTNCEDLPGFNGAGLYLSHGFEQAEGKKKLEQKIKEIFASLWTSYAFSERAFYHIKHNEAAMAILINEAYENEEANGVVLTIPSEKNVSVYINTQPSSHLVTNPKSGEIPEAIFFNSSTETTYETRSHSSFSDVFLLKENESLLQELKELSAKIHNLLTKDETKYGTDIEFKIIKECGEKKIIVKQARLIYDASPY